MKAYICDVCGEVVGYVLEISARPKYIFGTGDWSEGNISRQYCAKCAALLDDAVFNMLPKHIREDESVVMSNAAIHRIDCRYYNPKREEKVIE